MSAGASSESEPRARAWFLIARFDLAEHTRLVDSDKDRIFPEYANFWTNVKFFSRHV